MRRFLSILVPAKSTLIPFRNRNYVTPIPEVSKKHADERDWERVRGAVLAVYG